MNTCSTLPYILQHVGTTSITQAALDKETEAKLQEIDGIYEQKKDVVISAIGKRATVVQPEPHRNLKKQAA
jgi:V-type H+-transporting ATPase subunit G